MKHIKTFENKNSQPEIGDYVYCIDTTNFGYGLDEFLKDAIGEIVDIDYEEGKINRIYVEFDELPELLFDKLAIPTNFLPKEILFWSKDIEEVELFRDSQKYNL